MPLTALLTGLLLAVPQSDFPKNETNRWAYGAISIALREGLLGETQYGVYPYATRGIHDRYGVAILLQQSAVRQKARGEALTRGKGGAQERAAFLRCAALLPAFRKADLEFSYEIETLDAKEFYFDRELMMLTQKVRARSEAKENLFADIPQNHWAAKAVGDLRALEMLHGHPNDRFMGS